MKKHRVTAALMAAFLWILCIPALAMAAAVAIATDTDTKSYFEYQDDTGEWLDLETARYFDAATGTSAFGLEQAKKAPEDTEYFVAKNSPFDEKAMRGIINILEHSFAEPTDFTGAQIHYATANALSAWIFEATGEGYPHMHLANERLRPKEGYEALFNYVQDLVAYARDDIRLKRPWITLSRESAKWKYDGEGSFTTQVQIDLLGMHMKSYQIENLPDDVRVEGYTGKSGDILQFQTETPIDCAFSFSGRAAHTASNLRWLIAADGELQPLVLVDVETQERVPVAEFSISEPDEIPTPEPTPESTPEPEPTPSPTATPDPTEKPAKTATPAREPDDSNYTAITDDPSQSDTLSEQPTIAPTETPISNIPETVAITLTDIMTGKGIQGAEIAIADNFGVTVRVISSDDTGIAYFDQPSAGKYTFYQTKAAPGYTLNTNVFAFSINENGSVTGALTMGNAPGQDAESPDTLTINQLDAATGLGLSGLSLQVRATDGTIIASGMTDNLGAFSFPRPVSGAYTILETAPLAGYTAIPADMATFALNNSDILEGKLDIARQPLEAQLRAQGNASGEMELRLLGTNGEIVRVASKTDSNGIAYFQPSASGMESFTMEKSAILRYLPAGNYTLEEISLSPGYAVSPPASFAISEGANPCVLELPRNPLTVKISGKDAETGQPLTNASYSISNEGGETLQFTYSDGAYYYDGAGFVTDISPDETGILLICALPEGKYTVAESVQLPGYLPQEAREIILRRDNSTENPAIAAFSYTADISAQDETNSWLLIALPILVIGAGVGFFVLKKRGKNAFGAFKQK